MYENSIRKREDGNAIKEKLLLSEGRQRSNPKIYFVRDQKQLTLHLNMLPLIFF